VWGEVDVWVCRGVVYLGGGVGWFFLRGFRSVGMIKAGSMGGLLMGKKPCTRTHTSTPPTRISRHVHSAFSEVIRIPLMLSSNHQA